MGNHRKLTPELIAKAAELTRQGLPLPSIAAACNVSASGFRGWLQHAREGTGSPDELALLAAIQDAQTHAEANLVSRIIENADWRAAAWWLTHHPLHRDVWSDRAAERRAVEALLTRVAAGIRDCGLPPDQQQQVLLAMQAAGVGVEDEPGE